MSVQEKKSPRDRPPICAVVVTYFPDERVEERLRIIAAECEHVVVVDNSAPAAAFRSLASLAKPVEVLAQHRNLGVAAALNVGLERALALGFSWALTFDQDSTPQPGFSAGLWAARLRHAMPEQVAVVGPRLREENLAHEDHRWVVPHPRYRWWFRCAPCRDADLPGVAFVITSGALMDLRAFQRIGPMDAGLFIDYVDHDYCLRARQLGYDIVVSKDALLVHNLGAKREFRIGARAVRPTFHSALRLRYMFRNRRIVRRRYAHAFPHWACFDFVSTHHNLVRIALFEDQRGAKLRAICRGTCDGWLGRSGPIEV